MSPFAARSCAHCGLPVPAWWRAADAEPVYCCYGCRFAARVTGAMGHAEGESRWLFARLGLAIFFTMNVMVFTMALWSADIYGTVDAPLSGLFRYLCLFFALPVLWLLGGPLFENACISLRDGVLNTDLLLVIGVGAAYGYSAVSVLRDAGPVYFEVGCAVLLLVTVGRWLEATGRTRATRALDAMEKLLPERVRLLGDGTEKPLGAVAIGDRLHVRAGERVPCDGTVLGLAARIDEQLLTGESTPCVKEPGDAVHAGTLNLDGDLYLEVHRAPDAGALSRIVRLIRQAHASRGTYEQLADRITAWFLPMVGCIAVATLMYHAVQYGIDRGLMAALAVLVIACPCALAIATPLAIWVATSEAACQHVLFQSSEALQQLASVAHLCFDKTGTLTDGASAVDAWIETDTAALDRALALAAASNHSYAHAIVAFGKSRSCTRNEAANVQTLPGRGLCGQWGTDADTTYLGSERLMAEQGMILPDLLRPRVTEMHKRGQPLVCVGWAGQVRGLFVLREQVRPEARAVIDELRALGLGITILTGDHAGRAEALARALGVPAQAELLPEQKTAFVMRLKTQGRVAMVGDGINDGPALAVSDVGIAMGCGADVARDSAGVCLLDNDLTRLVWAIRLARRTVGIIRQNLFWAFAYNVVGIGLAAADLLNPVLAAAAMALSSMLVLANSLRLRAPTEASSPCSKPS